MLIPDIKTNDLTPEYLDNCYGSLLKEKNLDDIINALILLDEQLQKFPFYNDKKDILRQFIAEKLYEELEILASDNKSADYLIFSRKIEAFFFCYKLFLNISESDFKDEELYKKIKKNKQQAKERQDFSYLPEVIVSLTSFPGRIDKIYIVLNSVFTQTFRADRVILWLAEEQFPEKELPKSLLDYEKLGLEIRWCKEDIRSHKKYYYVMQEYPKAIVITVDDDLIYDKNMIEVLVTSYLHHPDAVSAMRTHLMKTDDNGGIAPYMKWGNEFSGVLGYPSMQLFATSGGGTLFPPDCMDKELFNMENIRLLAPNADDLWFKIMQVKKGTPVVLAKRNEKLKYVPGSQEIGLRHDNMENHGNDIQLAKLLSVYDTDGVLLKEIFKDNYSVDSCVIGTDVFNNNEFGTLSVKCTALENKNKKLIKELKEIKNSASFKVGRVITLIPRKIRGGIRCIRENGVLYTVKKMFNW